MRDALAILILFASPAAQACLQPAEQSRRLALGQRMLEDALALPFAEAQARVPAFGARAYGWAQSYSTGWRMLRDAALRTRDSVLQGSVPDGAAIMEAAAGPAREAFRQQVLAPPFTGWQADMAHMAATLGRNLPGMAAQLQTSLPAGPEAAVAALDAATLQLRSTRPLATRAVGMVLRVTEAGSIVGGGSYLGWAAGGPAGAALGAAAGVGLSWGADWAINRVDSSLHREGFEAEAQALLRATRATMRREAMAAIAAALAGAACP